MAVGNYTCKCEKIVVMQPVDHEAREVVLSATRALVGVAARTLAEVSAEVSLAQYRVVVLLHGGGPQKMGDLAGILDVNPSTVTRVCDTLVDKGLIRRQTSQDNRRTVIANLTSRGRKLVDGVMEQRRGLIDDVLDQMSPPARRRLARSMAEFAEAADEFSDSAWALGWSVDQNAGGHGDR